MYDEGCEADGLGSTLFMSHHVYGVLAAVLFLLVLVLTSACFGRADRTPAAVASATPTSSPTASATPTSSPTIVPTSTRTPTPVLPTTPTPTPEPRGWWTVMQTTWRGTFEVKLEIHGSATITDRTELRARTWLRTVSQEPGEYVTWSQFDPAVPVWVVLPVDEAASGGEGRPVLRLIQLRAEDDEWPSPTSFLETQHATLKPGDAIEREVSWDLTVRGAGSGGREDAADGVYTLRADFYAEDGQLNPGMPDVVLEFPITLSRGIG